MNKDSEQNMKISFQLLFLPSFTLQHKDDLVFGIWEIWNLSFQFFVDLLICKTCAHKIVFLKTYLLLCCLLSTHDNVLENHMVLLDSFQLLKCIRSCEGITSSGHDGYSRSLKFFSRAYNIQWPTKGPMDISSAKQAN